VFVRGVIYGRNAGCKRSYAELAACMKGRGGKGKGRGGKVSCRTKILATALIISKLKPVSVHLCIAQPGALGARRAAGHVGFIGDLNCCRVIAALISTAQMQFALTTIA